MTGVLFKNCAAIVVDYGQGAEVVRNVDLLTEGPAIKSIGPALDAPGATIIDATGWFLYP
ncbi:MAG: amidohydrolase, partial [Pseudomonadota bacterium]